MRVLLAAVIFIITIIITTLFFMAPGQGWWFPPIASEYGGIDSQFVRTLIVVGVAFVLSHLALGYIVWRYGNEKVKAEYSHGNTKLEIFFTGLTALVFIITAFLGQKVWAELHLTQIPANAIKIEVTGQQFAWNFRYPGPDGKFGKTDPKLIDDSDNKVGVDPKDPDGKDDITRAGKMVVPVGQPVHLILRTKDVTHNFFVPELRFKQDAVPGLSIPVHFKATRTGTFEIACSELCGLGHYKMKGVLEVRDQASYENWLKTGQ
jgi:cytochrome c oxidase subunit II